MPTFPATLLVLLLALVHCVTSNTTYSTCYTKRATTSKASVGSTTYALTLTKTASQTITSTPSKTLTPSTSTTTVSASVTSTFTVTASQVTDTFSTTTTVQVADTVTVTFPVSTSTSISTTTTFLTSTTTVPAAPGFTPLGAYVSGVNQKRSLNGRFDIRAAATTTTSCVKKGSDGRPTHSPALYPSTVTCGVLVIATKTATKTITASTTTTLTAVTPISTVSTTLSFSTTSTVLLIDASTTSTLSTTTTSTTLTTIFPTTTVTSTSTVTQQAPVSTAYAQCQPNNIVTNVNGNGISQVNFLVSEYFTSIPAASSPAACCALCAQSATCVTYAYFGANECELQTRADGVCQGNAAVNEFFTQPQTDHSYAIGNGACGQYAFSGVT